MTSRIEKALEKAWIMAEDYSEGSIVIQYLKNGTYLVTHQIGNSWPDLGYGGAYGSENRIIQTFDCRDYEPMYWEGEKRIEKNRLIPQQFDDLGGFHDILEDMENEVDRLRREDKKR